MEQAQLIEAVEKLTIAVGELSRRADLQQKVLDRIERVSVDTRHNRIGLQVATIGIVLDLALTVFGSYLFAKVDANTHQVQEVQARTSTEILCPLYTVFALSIKSNPAPANLTPEQAEVRRQAGDTIAAGLRKLECA